MGTALDETPGYAQLPLLLSPLPFRQHPAILKSVLAVVEGGHLAKSSLIHHNLVGKMVGVLT